MRIVFPRLKIDILKVHIYSIGDEYKVNPKKAGGGTGGGGGVRS